MNETKVKIHHWLYPLSWLYGMGVYLRNKLFDWGYFQSKSFDVPVICIGNLAVGGTGKTPHTEYLIKLLTQTGANVAMLSRGYKRKSKGYVLSNTETSVKQIGDEPYQIKNKFPNIRVAVDENRCNGIEQLMELENPKVDVVLLDDAFQHRHVKAGLNILLTDFNRLFCDDALLPAGLLRETSKGKLRAQIVIVTKCPDDIKPIDFNIIAKRLELFPYQKLYFSSLIYGELKSLFGNRCRTLESIHRNEQVLLITGIAAPATLIEKLHTYTPHVEVCQYSDHHDFSNKDLKEIADRFERMGGTEKLIITTEKDATKLMHNSNLPQTMKQHIYVLPIEIEILQNQQHIFNQNIIEYVKSNSRNSNLPKR